MPAEEQRNTKPVQEAGKSSSFHLLKPVYVLNESEKVRRISLSSQLEDAPSIAAETRVALKRPLLQASLASCA